MSNRRRVSSGSPYEPTIGFSRAVRVGDRVLVSGTAPIWPDRPDWCDDDAEAQARRCLEIIEAALIEAGASRSDVVRTRMFLTDAADGDAVGRAHGAFFADVRAAARAMWVGRRVLRRAEPSLVMAPAYYDIGPHQFQVTGDGAHTLEFRSVDLAGNVEEPGSLEFEVDGTKPTIEIASPEIGAQYLLDAEVAASYSCEDALSGIHRCEGSVPDGDAIDTSSVGTSAFEVRAEDLAGMAEQFYRTRKFSQAREAATEALQLRPGYEPARALLEKVQGEGKSLADGFELDLASDRPITLKFKDADVREVFNILAKLSGINFIYDEEIRSQRVSVLLEDASFAQALELLLNMNKLGKKVLNPKTIIVYPKTKEKEKQYEDQLIQTFYLSNIDAKKAVNMLRTMLQLRKIYVHEELNALVIRDTPEVIKLARQIIALDDLHRSKKISDEAYQKRRAELKEVLKGKM